jgi:hypothetical protein
MTGHLHDTDGVLAQCVALVQMNVFKLFLKVKIMSKSHKGINLNSISGKRICHSPIEFLHRNYLSGLVPGFAATSMWRCLP